MHLPRLLPLAGLALAVGLALGPPARAEGRNCAVPAIAGDWKRAGPGQDKELVRLEIIHVCSPDQSGSRSVLKGQQWTVRAFARCRPRDCLWGRSPAEPGDAPDELLTAFVTFAALRVLRMTRRGDLLEVDIAIEYHDDRRDKALSTATFVRAD